MMPNRKKATSCWTCRLRRKKCDNALPACSGCATLEINCFRETNRPEWMDNASRQREMTQRIKAEIKLNGRRRRAKRKIQIIEQHISNDAVDTSSPAPSGSVNASTAESEPSSHVISFPRPSTSHTSNSDTPFSGNGLLQHHPNNFTRQDASSRDLLLPDTLETIFVMAYLDYVFPISFPFYRPKVLEGGRSWLLNSILKNKCLRHTIISLTSYFFSVVKVNPASAHQICEVYTWDALQHQTELALKKAQRDLHEFSRNGDILDKANLMESIVQLLSVELMLSPSENWQIHLDAAGLVFQQLLQSHTNDDESHSAFSQILRNIGSHSPLSTPSTGPMWDPDQAAFRFFSAIIIFHDVIASTSLEQPPRFLEHYPHLLRTGLNPNSEPSLQLSDFLGCPNWVAIAIAETAALAAWKRSMKKENQLSIPELVRRAALIDEGIQNGLALVDSSNSEPLRRRANKRVPTTFLDTQSLHPHCAQSTLNTIAGIWALSARSYLLTTVSGWQLANVDLRGNVAESITLLGQLAPSPTMLRTLAWPFCVTGCLVDADEEVLLRQIVSDMGSLQAYGMTSDAVRIMETVWRNRSDMDADSWNLARCLGCLGHRVLLV